MTSSANCSRITHGRFPNGPVYPYTPIVLIATARLLREQGRGEAEAALDLVLNEKSVSIALGCGLAMTVAARLQPSQ